MEEHTPMVSPSVSDLYARHRFTPYLIDLFAGVPSSTTNMMIRTTPVPKQDAERVLIAISGWAREVYHLDTVTVTLVPEEGATP